LESNDDGGVSCTVRLNIEKAVEISRLFRLKHFVLAATTNPTPTTQLAPAVHSSMLNPNAMDFTLGDAAEPHGINTVNISDKLVSSNRFPIFLMVNVRSLFKKTDELQSTLITGSPARLSRVNGVRLSSAET